MPISVVIRKSFACLPARKISNSELGHILRLPFDQIKRHTGIDVRRYAHPNEAASDLAIKALKPLYTAVQSPLHATHTNALLLATTSGDFPSPATASFVHRGLALPSQINCLDVASSCTSFLSALRAACGFLEEKKQTVVVASEVKHKSLSQEDIRTTSLFADGAAGVVLEKSQSADESFHFSYQKIDSELANHISIPVGGSREPTQVESLKYNKLVLREPKKLYVHTVKSILDAVESLCQEHAEENIQNIFIHQANKNIIADVKARLPHAISRKIPTLMSDVGNMVCASLPVLRTRILFLRALLSVVGRPIGKHEITHAFLRACQENSDFQFCAFKDGLLFQGKYGNEEISIFDDGATTLENSWLSHIAEEEWTELLEAWAHTITSNKVTDFWIAAGGGFQTLGWVQHSLIE